MLKPGETGRPTLLIGTPDAIGSNGSSVEGMREVLLDIRQVSFQVDGHSILDRLDLTRRQVFVDSEEVHLTPMEYKLLVALARCRGCRFQFCERYGN